jgi:4-amino-4-deoxy-L-arabinose transferase-like glycosyltransferase
LNSLAPQELRAGMPCDPPVAVSDCLLALLLGAGIVVSFFLGIDSVPLFDVDEGAFSEATREMFVRGDFVSTYLNGEPRYDKPILIYWLQSLSVVFFGIDELAFRLPSAIAASLWAAAIFLFVRRRIGPRTAIATTLIMVTTLQVSIMGRAAIADALLNLWIAAAMFALFVWLEQQRKGFLYLAALFTALGFLTKGPIAVLIPVAVSLIFSLTGGSFRLWLRTAFNPFAWLIFAAVGLPWYVVQYLREGDAFIQGFFLQHNVERFTDSMEQHGGAVFYFVPVVLVGLIPYTSFILAGLKDGLRHWRDPLTRYLLIWFGFVFVFFSLAATKLPHYVVYGYTALFVLGAPAMLTFRSHVWAFLPQLLLLLGLLGLPHLIDPLLTVLDDRHAVAMLADADTYFTPGYHAAITLGVLISLYFMLDRRWPIPHKAAVSGLGVTLLLGALILPLIGAIQQAPVKEAAAIAVRDGRPAVMWRLNLPSFSVYRERVTPRRDPVPGELVLTRTIHLEDLAAQGAVTLLYQRNGIALATLDREAGP